MFPPHEYQLLDFGNGRKLERFGPLILDRPSPAAENVARAKPAAWDQADGRFERSDDKRGEWTSSASLPPHWTIRHEPFTLELKPTEFGHLGVFPEQAPNWDWMADQLAAAGRPLQVLNLFAYTGGSTLAAAVAGAKVVHVDSAKNTVARARRNAELSGMADAPIRWIVDDALKFTRRELKRGNGYDAVILDPPSYGHGARGEVWQLSKHLPELLETCAQLTAGRRRFILLTCHTPGFDAPRLSEILAHALDDSSTANVSAQALSLQSATNRVLPSGIAVRWQSS